MSTPASLCCRDGWHTLVNETPIYMHGARDDPLGDRGAGRVGLASELTSRGASTTDVMLAGNWKTSRMVAHYSTGAIAECGAVARYL